MAKTREELSQGIIESIGNILNSLHNKGRFNRDHRNMGRHFADLDLSRKQIFFLFIVARKDGVSVKDLARFSHVTSGAVTQFIDSLIEKNLLRREEDPNDRRSVKIKLTDYAKSKFSNFKRGFFTSFNPIFDNLSDDELNTLLNLLNKISTPDQGQCPSGF